MVTFALTPARITLDIIDYSTAKGVKLFSKVTDPLRELYDGSAGKFTYFMSQVRDRTVDSGWEDIMFISAA